jgi:hypothetical protein
VLALSAVLGALSSPAGAVAPEDAVSVSIKPAAQLVGEGQAVQVQVRVACDPEFEVLEANLSVSQEDASGFAGIGGITCDGRQQTLLVPVNAQDSTFERGAAFASAFVLVIDQQTQETRQGQDSGTIRIH